MSFLKKYTAFCLCLMMFSCENPFYYEKTHDFKGNEWFLDEKVDFSVDQSDTNARYDFFIDLRHQAEYPYQNFWIFMDTKSPSGIILKDTIELKLANYQGKWLGKTASGNLISHHIQIAKNQNLPEPGTYIFSLWNGSREENNHPLLHSVGMSVVKLGL